MDIFGNSLKGTDTNLLRILDTIFCDDQLPRKKLKEVEAKYGKRSTQVINQNEVVRAKDKNNVFRVLKILNQYGWPSTKVIGAKGSLTLFMVILHADLEVQEKYLSVMRTAVTNLDLQLSNLALVEIEYCYEMVTNKFMEHK